MRILYLAPIDPSLPLGHAVHLRRLTAALEARRHEVRWLSLRAAAELPGVPPRGGWTEVARVGPAHSAADRVRGPSPAAFSEEARLFDPTCSFVDWSR
ncbi:MAG: hypothetical protein U0527_13820 [Candidatus Eisenbacteria bacterium]